MRLKLAAIALGIVVVASAFGASAFTTATVDRDANINVVTDANGLIGLEAGNASGGIVGTTDTGSLTIDFSNDSTVASGVNANSTVTVGDTDAGAPQSVAFNITNNGATSHDFELDYTLNKTEFESDGTTNVEFFVYNSSAQVTTASEDSSSDLISIGPEETRYVTIKINTTGLSSNDDLSGTLNITA